MQSFWPKQVSRFNIDHHYVTPVGLVIGFIVAGVLRLKMAKTYESELLCGWALLGMGHYLNHIKKWGSTTNL